MKPVIRHISPLQRAQISASKKWDKETQKEKWDAHVRRYLKLLEERILPAQAEGIYIRVRPKDIDSDGELRIIEDDEELIAS